VARSDEDHIPIVRSAFADCPVKGGRRLFWIGGSIIIAGRVSAGIDVVHVAGGE
jgi:hypothetical protein